ncbi:MAG: DNA polymerase IV [Bacteroidales bacterium]|jgi:DNA polymerase-4|nr:DNA polymerase IV [Bacteroidales bacterium]HOI33078.1 DNA polymerase IV [Bacteroidales bacterium]
MPERTIAHLDLDTFFVSVERLVNPSLTGKPVIIGGVSDRGVVASCSYEARRFGVHSAMPMRMARQLCGQAVYIRGDMELYSRYSRLVTDVIADSAPLYEKTSVDEHYLDLTGMDRFFGTYKWTHELRQRIIRETGLPISFGLSQNKTISKIATGQAKPNGELQVLPNQVHPFLDPLSIRKIPMVGEVGYRLLRAMGVAKIGTLRLMPPDMVQQVLGKNGLIVWKKANGIDPSPVKPYSEQKSISSEHTFDQDTTDMALLKQTLTHIVEKITFEMRSKQKLTGCVTVKIRYANFDTHSRQKHIAYTAFDHILLNTVMDLFVQLYNRRMLIRLIGVRFSHLVGGSQQLDLFDDKPEISRLYQTMDHIRRRYGKTAVGRAGGMKPSE